MDLAGLAIGIAGLAGQLAKVSQEWSKIFSEMKEIGYAHDSVLHNLRTEGLRLKQWEQAWGLDQISSQQNQCIDPNDERYRYAVASLARIVAVFARVAELQAQYQGEPGKDDKHGKLEGLGVGRLFSKFRSKSPHPGSSSNSGRPASCNPQPSIPSLTSVDLSLLENPHVLTNKQLLPGLKEEIACLDRVAQNMQQSVPIYLKLRWASTDKANCKELVGQLTNYINGLYNVLPPDATVPRMPQTRSFNLSFDIPFSLPDVRRNSDFVGRKYLLEKLKTEIKDGATTKDIIQVVLYGMGGVGKTHLALEYVYRHSGDYSSVFWINAANEQTTKIGFTHIMQRLIEHHTKLSDEPDYTYIGRLLGMAGKLNQAGTFTVQQPGEEQHVVDAVKKWLTVKDNTKWLLVFDNLDDLESFDINNYIPSSPHGTVIITSKRRESVHGRRCLEVEQMEKTEAEELLFNSAKPKLENLTPEELHREKEAATTIVQILEHLPLAIDQAGAYIYARQYSFSRYLKEYEANVTFLLSKEWKVGKHDRSVFAAWDLSFRAIQSQNSEAAELLLLCGFFDNNDICEDMLRRGMKLPMDDTSLGNLIQTLFSYSMAKRKDRDDSFNIHPLVHLWAQKKLQMEPERHSKKAIEALFIIASAIDIPTSRRKVEDWAFERRIMPHIFAIERQIKTMTVENKQLLMAVDNIQNVYMQHGYYKKAEEMCGIVLAGREKTLDVEHPDTLTTIHNMALLFRHQGQYKKALELLERALAGREKALGIDQPDILTTVNDMAIVFRKQGEYKKALELYERALAGREKALGKDHPDTLTTVHHMAFVFRQQENYKKALDLYERALSGREKALGKDHPDTLTTVTTMAYVFGQQGEYKKALHLYERALAGRETALGKDHPYTLSTVHKMAIVFERQGQYNMALELYERALVGREKSLGLDHPDTLATVNNMAVSFEAIGQFDKAQALRERVSRGSSANAGI
ncbi:P-loop containing nucleoside triphosphate hydrolase protein [Kalaharituber pfeilii]|nr:P-loop containing nucleoside triphosphate hydrolase protein [Kalaharituber pfeilii]